MLTRKQHELLTYIDRHLRETGFSPSFEEMKEALQLRSKSGIHRLISALEERGFLKRRHHRARALEVVRMPNEIALQPAARGGAHGTAAFAPAAFAPPAFAPPAFPACAPRTKLRPCSFPSTGGSLQACRSRRCATRARRSRYRPRC